MPSIESERSLDVHMHVMSIQERLTRIARTGAEGIGENTNTANRVTLKSISRYIFFIGRLEISSNTPSYLDSSVPLSHVRPLLNRGTFMAIVGPCDVLDDGRTIR